MFSFVRQFVSTINVTSLVLNAILCPIIYYKSSKTIGTYKYLLLLLVIVEMYYSLILLLTLPSYQTNKYGWIYHSTTNFLPKPIVQGLLVCVGGCLMEISTILAVSFLYRFAVTCRYSLFIWFENRLRLAVIGMIIVLVAVVFSGELIVFYLPDEQTLMLIDSQFEDEVVNLREYASLAIPIFFEDGSWAMKPLITLASWTVWITVCTYVYIFVTVNMIRVFNQMKVDASTRTMDQQRKIFALLIFQTITPILFSFVPCIGSYVLAYFSINGGKFAQIYSTGLSFVPILDPLLIFVFVKDYRYAFAIGIYKILGLNPTVNRIGSFSARPSASADVSSRI